MDNAEGKKNSTEALLTNGDCFGSKSVTVTSDSGSAPPSNGQGHGQGHPELENDPEVPEPSSSSNLDPTEDTIYTYRGDSRPSCSGAGSADLPSSFYHSTISEQIDMSGMEASSSRHSRRSSQPPSKNDCSNGIIYSPDMDYIEMDFDPGVQEEDEEEDAHSQEYNGNCNLNQMDVNHPHPSSSFTSHHSNSSNTNTAAAVLGRCGVDGTDGVVPVPLNPAPASLQKNPVPVGSDVDVSNSTEPLELQLPLMPCTTTTTSTRIPTQFSLRLVKSNTLPEIGQSKEKGSNSSTSTSICSSTCCHNAMTSFSSSSVPVIRIENQQEQQQTGFRAFITDASVGAGAGQPGQRNHDTSGTTTTTTTKNSSSSPESFSVEFQVQSVSIFTVEEARSRVRCNTGEYELMNTIQSVLSSLGYDENQYEIENIKTLLNNKKIKEDSELPDYLLEKSRECIRQTEIIEWISIVTHNSVYGKFFRIKSIQSEDLSRWLLQWICRGAIPVITHQPDKESLPLHQMVFGVTPGILYLTCPVQSIKVEELINNFKREPIILIKRNEIIERKKPRTDLRKLARYEDKRWNMMNVLGQVGNVILEEKEITTPTTSECKRLQTNYIQIPGDWVSGVTLFIHRSSQHFNALDGSCGFIGAE